MSLPVPPPRLHAIVATAAPGAVVFVHTRSWWHVAQWDLNRRAVQPGAWLKGTLYPRRSALSPDGAVLYTFAMKRGRAYHALSRSPWLTALALWFVHGTYHNGCVFVSTNSRRGDTWGPPDLGDPRPLAHKHRLHLMGLPTVRLPALREAGWTEHPATEPRGPDDTWDQRRKVVLVRTSADGRRLVLTSDGYKNEPGAVEGHLLRYHLEATAPHGQDVPLPGVTWADWDLSGRLATATKDGEVQLRDPITGELLWRHSFVGLTPDPSPPPAHATRW